MACKTRAYRSSTIATSRKDDNWPKRDDEACEICLQKEAEQQLSRRPIPSHYGRTGRVYFDIVFLPEYGGKFGYFAHFYIEHIRFHLTYAMEHKSDVRNAIRKALSFIERWLKLRVLVLFSDNERGVDDTLREQIAQMGLLYQTTPAEHPVMNGSSERSGGGGVIVTLMRALLLEGGLPGQLWPHAMTTAVYMLNRLPTWIEQDSKWIIPLQEVRRIAAPDGDHTIDLSNLRVYGCAVYARKLNIPLRDKLSPRAKLGYLVGYVSANMWQVWFPETDTVEAVRDAVFVETKRYRQPLQPTSEDPIPELPESNQIVTEIDAMIEYHREMQSWGLTEVDAKVFRPETDLSLQQPNKLQTKSNEPRKETHEPQTKTHEPQVEGTEPQESWKTPEPMSWPTPEASPTPDITPMPNIDVVEDDDALQLQQELEQRSESSSEEQNNTTEWQYQPDVAPRDIDGDIDTSNIVEGGRTRRSRKDPQYKSYQTALASFEDEDEPYEVRSAYTTAFHAGQMTPRLHIDDLPKPPRHWKEMQKHPLASQFMQAARTEIEALASTGTFELVNRPNDVSKEVLPLLWVFTYKTDADSYLIKTKARICVRGDLQTLSNEEKRAATLAARTGKLMFALTAAFDMDTRQMDAINAFLNSTLTEEVYTELPEGFRVIKEKAWRLKRALYGLRKSPRLWQQEATRVLTTLGLKPIPEDPCLFVGKGVIVFSIAS
jgi:hypothetical protein